MPKKSFDHLAQGKSRSDSECRTGRRDAVNVIREVEGGGPLRLAVKTNRDEFARLNDAIGAALDASSKLDTRIASTGKGTRKRTW
jgi:hypothetical protein